MTIGANPVNEGVGNHRPVAASIIDAAIAALPFADRVSAQQMAWSPLTENMDYAVCVPAQDEERFLPASLASLIASMHRCDARGAIVLLVNNSTDGSWRLAHEILGASGCAYVTASVALGGDAADAPHARRIALDIGALLATEGTLMTTDADTQVSPDWATINLRHIRAGADLVCGSVSFDPQEYAALPEPVRRCGDIEATYAAKLERLWRRWTGGSAPSFQIAAMGASLALPTPRYREIGGMPTPRVGEDKALAKLARRRGWAITMAGDVKVETSGRLSARAIGGMGDALRSRATNKDPYCDEQMVPLALLRRLANIWNSLPESCLRFAQLDDAVALDPALQHPRMRLSQVLMQLTATTDDALKERLSNVGLLSEA